MVFKKWLNEAIVEFKNISDVIKQTLQYVVDDGSWNFEEKTYGLSSIKTVSIGGHFYNNKGHFFISIHVLANKPIDKYDSTTGQIDANSKVNILASVSYMPENKYGPKLLIVAQRNNNTEGGRLHTPYETAKWVKKIIDQYQPPNNDDNHEPEYDPTPSPSNSQLVTV